MLPTGPLPFTNGLCWGRRLPPPSSYSSNKKISPSSILRQSLRISLIVQSNVALLFPTATSKEIIAFIIDNNKCGEVFDFNFPDSFHPEFRII